MMEGHDRDRDTGGTISQKGKTEATNEGYRGEGVRRERQGEKREHAWEH